MNAKQDIVPNRSALANSNEGNTMTNTGYSGGTGRGHGGNCGGGGRGCGPPLGGGHGYGGQPNTDPDKLYSTHCGRYETCWNLNGKPRDVSATPVKVDHPN